MVTSQKVAFYPFNFMWCEKFCFINTVVSTFRKSSQKGFWAEIMDRLSCASAHSKITAT